MHAQQRNLFRLSRISAAMAITALAACGSGGSDDAPAVSPPPPAALTLTGTAATGAAIAAGTVDVKCSVGSGTATTAANGSYSLAITGAALPCTLRVTSGSVVLHSLATGSGSTATAHMTPVTELVVARLAGSDPAAYFGAFNATAATALTASAAQTAATAVVDVLKASGVDLSTAGDVLGGTLVPASGGTAGNAYDQALDTLKARLTASGTTLQALTQTVALASPAAPSTSTSTVASLPAELLLAPAAPNCSALRSGKYRIVVNQDGGTAAPTEVLTIDAPALTATNSQGEVDTLVATGDCKYSLPGGGDATVSKAGVIMARVQGNTGTPLHGAVLFPEQTHAVAALAGVWNALAFDRTTDNGPIHLTSATTTLDAAGKLTAITFCDDVRNCETPTGTDLPAITLSNNAAGGGFNVVNTSAGYTDRAFAYRAGGGELMWVVIANSGHISFNTRKAPANMPTLGRVQEGWNLTLNANYTATTAISKSGNTILSVDASSGSYTRSAVLNFSTGATRTENLRINDVREGFTRRLSATGVTNSDGSVGNVPEWVALGMRGMDMSVLAFLQSNQLGLFTVSSVTVPTP